MDGPDLDLFMADDPLGIFDRPDWWTQAACADWDPRQPGDTRTRIAAVYDVFFPERGKATNAPARAICADCPVRNTCRQYAKDHRLYDHGVFGGMSVDQRRRTDRPTRAQLLAAA